MITKCLSDIGSGKAINGNLRSLMGLKILPNYLCLFEDVTTVVNQSSRLRSTTPNNCLQCCGFSVSHCFFSLLSYWHNHCNPQNVKMFLLERATVYPS